MSARLRSFRPASAVVCWLGVGATAALLLACQYESDARRERAPAPPDSAGVVTVEARTNLLPAFPCSRCHAGRKPRPNKRKLVEFHTERNAFSHGDSKRWCYQCHSIQNIDRFVIAGGDLVTFNEGYRVCGSCHGDKLRDWRLGVHGSTRGRWAGPKTRKSCPACHNPHAPKIVQMTPQPPPPPPGEIELPTARR